ncbi:MAG: transposase [Ignavibacteriae bacterium]|nr:transposase [Ignavibacteria bacterium]MBI3363928.1 transposase [Ignavibacteriota bacterium]
MKKRIREFSIHQRHLPHWQLPGAVYHVVFTLKDSSICNLCYDEIAPIILKALSHYANHRYILYDHTVMPDHVHVILQPYEKDFSVEPLGDIVGDIKSYTARSINATLNRKGALWLDESYDRIIRDDAEYKRIAQYIFENPVRVGLVHSGEQWKWWRPTQWR